MNGKEVEHGLRRWTLPIAVSGPLVAAEEERLGRCRAEERRLPPLIARSLSFTIAALQPPRSRPIVDQVCLGTYICLVGDG